MSNSFSETPPAASEKLPTRQATNWEPSRYDLMRRKIEFPQIIIDISHNNAVVAKMVEAYVHGQLCTKEEAYCQIIKELSKTREQLVRQMVDEINDGLTSKHGGFDYRSKGRHHEENTVTSSQQETSETTPVVL